MSENFNVEQTIKEKGVWISTVEGTSMMPMLREGEDLIVVEQKPLKIKKYDVVLVRKSDRLVLHRITKVLENGFLFVGDNAFYREIIYFEQIIGVLKEFYKNDKLVKVTDKKYRRYAFFRVKTYYIRLFFYRLKNLFKRRDK